MPCISLSLLSRPFVFCSGLGDLTTFSNEDKLSSRLRDGAFSFWTEFIEPFTFWKGGGDLALPSCASAPTPLIDGMDEGGPSDDRMLRVACGSALVGGFLLDLKRKDMVVVRCRSTGQWTEPSVVRVQVMQLLLCRLLRKGNGLVVSCSSVLVRAIRVRRTDSIVSGQEGRGASVAQSAFQLEDLLSNKHQETKSKRYRLARDEVEAGRIAKVKVLVDGREKLGWARFQVPGISKDAASHWSNVWYFKPSLHATVSGLGRDGCRQWLVT